MSRCPVVSPSRRLVVPLSRRPVIPLSRCPVVSQSRRPVVPWSRCLAVSSSRWRASQAFPVILSLSQSFPVNRAPLSCLVVPQSPNRSPLSLTSLNSLISLNSLYQSCTFFTLQKYVKSQTINQITLSPKKKISHIFVYVEK